jgi:hypothetical protein
MLTPSGGTPRGRRKEGPWRLQPRRSAVEAVEAVEAVDAVEAVEAVAVLLRKA